MRKVDFIRSIAGLSVALCAGDYFSSPVVLGQTVAGLYEAQAPVVYQ